MRARVSDCHVVLLVLVALTTGCRTGKSYRFAAGSQDPSGASVARTDEAAPSKGNVAAAEDGALEGLVQPAALIAPVAEEVTARNADQATTQPTALDVDWLVAEVLRRNPDIRSATAAWRAAAARYPQMVALDDPMFGYMLGPDSWGDPDVDSAYAVELSQKFLWPGKRQLRGNIAQAEANAAYFDVGEQRLRIAEATRLAYYEYYLAHRQLEVLHRSQELLLSFRKIAQSKYESAEVQQQDVLLADVELAELERRHFELVRQGEVARARINTLLLVPPDAPLSPPVEDLPTGGAASSSAELQNLAIAQRPELAAQQARIRAERYAVTLACKEFYPDIEVVGRYDAFWQEPEDPLRPMVGMNLNLPIYKQKRYAAVREARARVVKEQADFDSKVAELLFAVEQAYQRLEESRQALTVYNERLLPVARQSVEAARSSYTAGSLDFLRVVESQRQSLAIQEASFEALAEFHRRQAELDRIVGFAPPRLESVAQ